AFGQFMPLALDQRLAGAGEHVQPLIGAAMAIVRIAFGVTGRDHHLGGLRAPVARHDAESLAEAQLLQSHAKGAALLRWKAQPLHGSGGFSEASRSRNAR